MGSYSLLSYENIARNQQSTQRKKMAFTQKYELTFKNKKVIKSNNNKQIEKREGLHQTLGLLVP